MLIDSVSIRKAAKELKLSVTTVFFWRHKLLSTLSIINENQFVGIVECDDKQLNISEKGNKKLEGESYKRPNDRNPKRGVSNDKMSMVEAMATNYLQNYLNWFIFLEKVKKTYEKCSELAKMIFENTKTINLFRNIQLRYDTLMILQCCGT